MDSVRKRPPVASPKTIYSFEQKNFHAKENDIFISGKEAGLMEKHEKISRIRKKDLIKRFFLLALAIILIAAISWVAYFSWKVLDVSKKMNPQNTEVTTLAQYVETIASPIVSTNKESLKGETEGRINILLLGAAGKNKPGGNLTDTVMIASIDTKNKKVALLSLPRDFYVPIADTKTFSKINSLYKIGLNEGRDVELIKETVAKILDIPIDYYLVINFDGFEKVINDIGGINIINERDIYDARYPGPNYSYETFELSKGFHKLDGATALKYVRERHDDPDGDFGRAKRQQQVIQAVKNKLFSAQTLFNVVALNNVLDTLGDNVQTNINLDEIDGFINLSKKVDMQNITNVVVDAWEKDSLLKVSHVMSGSVRAFILVPRVGNYSEIQDLAQNIFNQNEIKKRRVAISEESASVAIINKSGSSELPYKIQTLLKEKLAIKDVKIIPNKTNDFASKTLAFDATSGQKIFTLDELIKKLPATLSSDSGLGSLSQNNDIIITLGSDLIDVYKYEDDSIEDFKKYQDSDEYDNAENF